MIFLQLFIVFIQIGIFGFGGGYSMISLIQGQVVTQYHWMTMQEFTDVVAISQMTPGPIGWCRIARICVARTGADVF